MIFDDSITNFSRYCKSIFNQSINNCTAKSWYFERTLSQHILHYGNPKLERFEFDVAIIYVGVDDHLNCQSDINQINNILQNIENLANKCREYCVNNIFLSGQTIMNRLPEQLIKDFNISISNICSQTRNCDYINSANITLNEICRDG